MTETWRERAQAMLGQGLALEASGKLHEAFDCYRQATELDAGCGRAWRQAGNLLRHAGELGPASECFERAIAGGDDPALNKFFLSAVGVGEVVAAPPDEFVSELFDQYAERFDEHLLEVLDYRAPQILFDLVQRLGPVRHERVLDLGCGTGLSGQAFRPIAGAIVGVDLSREMLARAARTGAYGELIHGSMEHYLGSAAATFDLVICCDAFNYVGELAAVFAGVRRSLAHGGGFAFTIELCGARSGIDLLASLRYAHTQAYVERLAQAHGFEVRGMVEDALRRGGDEPVQGLAVYLSPSGR